MTIIGTHNSGFTVRRLEKPQVVENPRTAWGSSLPLKLSWVPFCAQTGKGARIDSRTSYRRFFSTSSKAFKAAL